MTRYITRQEIKAGDTIRTSLLFTVASVEPSSSYGTMVYAEDGRMLANLASFDDIRTIELLDRPVEYVRNALYMTQYGHTYFYAPRYIGDDRPFLCYVNGTREKLGPEVTLTRVPA